MDLTLWPGQWTLASFDPESLSVLTYVKFGGLPVNLKTQVSLSEAPEGNIPYLEHDRNVSFGLRAIFEYLRKENYGIEYDFSEPELVRLNTLMKTVEVELLPAVKHTWFLNVENLSKCTRRLYSAAVGFPHSLYFGSWLHSRVHNSVYQGHAWPSTSIPNEMMDKTIYNNAKSCITSLSYLLDDKLYFLGDRPSAIDAVVFGFLFPILRAPLPDNPLKEHVSHCVNLAQFCSRIQTRFFDPPSLLQRSPKQINSNASNSDGLESAFSLLGLRNLALFGVAALVANFTYAFATNMVEVEVADEEETE